MPNTFQRQRLAVMFTDIEGYTSLTFKDEMLALSLVDKKRSILKPLLKEYKGTFVKEMGDGTVTYFKDPSEATDCAIKLQGQAFDDKYLNIRIGIHYGDTIIKNNDVFGETVNIASRIENLGISGGIFISKEARDKIKKPHNDISLGLQTMKGVGRLIEVYGLKGKQLSSPEPKDYEKTKIRIHSDDEVPSIAIIPFENKGRAEDVFYAYGISADLISDCSNAGSIRVASIKDVEKIEYKTLNVNELSKKLFARYIVQGTLWKIDEMFQVSLELYDTKRKSIIWADRWHESWNNLPTIKNKLAIELLKALDITLSSENQEENFNVEAYKYYLEGKYVFEKRQSKQDIKKSRMLLNKAIKIDADLMLAKNLLGTTYLRYNEPSIALEIFISNLKQSKKLNSSTNTIAKCLNNVGVGYYYLNDMNKSIKYINEALEIFKKNNATESISSSLSNLAASFYTLKEYDKAHDYANQALKIARNINSDLYIARAFEIRGTIISEQGYITKGINYNLKAQRIYKKLDLPSDLVNSYSNVVDSYSHIKQYDKALKFSDKAIKILNALDEHRGLATAWLNRGNVYNGMRKLDKAKDCYMKSQGYYKIIKDQKGIGSTLNGLGNMYFYNWVFDESLNFYKQFMEISKNNNNQRSLSLSFHNIAGVYKIKGSYKAALKNYMKALAIRQEISHREGEIDTLFSIGEIYYDMKNYSKSKEFLEKSICIMKDLGIENTSYANDIYLVYYLLCKKTNVKFDNNIILEIIKKSKDLEFEHNYIIYKLLKKESYLEIAYNQVKELAKKLEPNLNTKFFTYPTPKKIIDEYKKLTN